MMASRSLALVAALAAQLYLASAQGASETGLLQPDIAAATTAVVTCGGCYAIADVIGIVFGTETFTNTITSVTSIGVGNNGTNITTTYTAGTAEFSFAPSGIIGGNLPETALDPGPTATIGTLVLVSPNAYNLLRGYSTVQTIVSDGSCVAVTGTAVSESIAIQVPPGVDPSQYVASAQQQFESDLGEFSCLFVGPVSALQVQTRNQLTVLTSTSVTVGPIRLTPQAQPTPFGFVPATAAATTTFITAAGPTAVVIGSITYLPSGNANYTIIPFMGSGSTNDRSIMLLAGAGIFSLVIGIWAL